MARTFPPRFKKKRTNDGPPPNPFEEETRIERSLFRDARLQTTSVEKGGVENICDGINSFKKKSQKNLLLG